LTKPQTLDRPADAAKRPRAFAGRLGWIITLGLPLGLPLPALAGADGCTILLCLAAPNWRAIPQCVPPIRQMLRDLALGRSFPTCNMAGAVSGGDGGSGDTSASHAFARAPDFCPPQYTSVVQGENSTGMVCNVTGAVSVSVNGALFTRTWWTLDGSAVTEYSPAAKAQLGSWDTRFDDDYTAWLAVQPPPSAPVDQP
jgi:hypothetical protein